MITGASGGKASAPGRIRHSGYREHRGIADSSEYGKYNNGIIFKPCAGDGSGGIVLGILACLRMKTWPDLLRTLAIPAGSCCACGLLAFGLVEKICLPHPGGNGNGAAGTGDHRCSLLVLLLMLRSFRGQDLNYVPGGKVLRAFGKTLRLL